MKMAEKFKTGGKNKEWRETRLNWREEIKMAGNLFKLAGKIKTVSFNCRSKFRKGGKILKFGGEKVKILNRGKNFQNWRENSKW
jgi:hypothetical protein